MKKVFLILLCLLIAYAPIGAGGVDGANKPGKNTEPESPPLRYKFDYTFRGHVTGVFLLLFRYRFFFYANASVILDARPTKENCLEFRFRDIAGPGKILRSWGFKGKVFLTGIAHFDTNKAREYLKHDAEMLKEVQPDYPQYVKMWRRYPFWIKAKERVKLNFKRAFNGVHRDASIYMPYKRMRIDNKYYFHFNIYPMLLDMIKTYDHAFCPGGREELLKLEQGREWKSPDMDYSDTMNRVGGKATLIVKKYVRFKQKEPFKLTYRVTSRTPDSLTIKGTASPQAKIWGSFKIVTFTRTVRIRLPDGVVLEDSFYAGISKARDKGGSAQCSLTLIK